MPVIRRLRIVEYMAQICKEAPTSAELCKMIPDPLNAV